MTKKHYIAIAAIIKEQIDKSARDGWESEQAAKAWKISQESTAFDIADYFQDENPSFDRARFLAACGVR